MRVPFPLQQANNDEHDKDEDEEGDGEPDVQGEVAGGDALVLLVGVGDDRQVSRHGQARSAEPRRARAAVHILALAVTAAVRWRWVRAVPSPHLVRVVGQVAKTRFFLCKLLVNLKCFFEPGGSLGCKLPMIPKKPKHREHQGTATVVI